MKTKLKIAIDTNVIVSALRSRNGASNKLMTLIGTNKFITCISVGLILEYEDVLTRNFHGLSKKSVKEFLDYFCSVSEHVKVHFLWRPVLNDPNDDMLLELAMAAEAQYIVTYNSSDFKGIQKFNTRIIKPKQFLELIGELS